MMRESIDIGLVYTIETVRNGVVVDREEVHNLLPLEGIHHMYNVTLRNQTQNAAWYVGLFGNAYTPLSTDTMATFPANSGEATGYSEANRVTLVLAAPAAGSVSNSGNVAEFTFTGTDTIYGGFVTSSAAKGATTGTLMSAVKFATAKSVDDSTVLRVTASIQITST